MRGVTLTALLVLAASAACGDDPFSIPWEQQPDTVLLYSLARPELNLEAGFSFFDRRRVRIESAGATGQWDVALDTREGQLVLLPPGALGIVSRARVAIIEAATFDEVKEAPSDTTAYVAAEPVPVRLGNVYVVQTDQRLGAFGTRCVYYAKMEPLDVDVPNGTLTFVFDTNPVCNDLRLVPPE